MDHVLPPEGDADLPGFCRALGVPGLADVHTHFLPPRMLTRVWEYFDAAGPLIGIAWPIGYKWSDDERRAHLGAPDYGEFLGLAEEYERVRLDTTMVFTGFFDRFAPFPDAIKPRARELGMAGKILLGSDFPNLPYPYALQIAGLVRLGLGEDWLRAVCWDNP